MDEEFNYPVPTVYCKEGRESLVLDKTGRPYIIKEVKQPIGFKLWK